MILARYILAEFFQPLTFGVVIFSFVLLLDKLFDLADLIFNRGIPALSVLKLFVIFLPTILPLTIPMAILLATLVSYGRLAQDGEITAVRASGISLWKITWPILLLAGASSILLIPFNREVSPRAHAYFRRMFSRMISADPLLQLEPRQFFEMRDLKLYTEEVDPSHQRLGRTILYRMRADLPADRIFSQSGTYERAPDHFRLNLKNGQFERYDLQDAAKLLHARFQTYSIEVSLGSMQPDSSIDIHDLTSPQLSATLQEKGEQGPMAHELVSELQLRHAVALAPLALGLLGIPIGMVLDRGGRAMGFGVSVAVLFVYYLLLVLGLSLSERGVSPAGLSIWVANLVCLGIGSGLYARMLKK